MRSASELDTAIAKAIATVPECLAAGYVDVVSGLVLGIKTVDSHSNELIDLLAAATSDMFQGPNVLAFEQMFIQAGGRDASKHYFMEVIMNSDNLIHVFLRGTQYQDYVMTFVCRNTANMGMILAKARAAMPTIESFM
jgi:hypothetical protein